MYIKKNVKIFQIKEGAGPHTPSSIMNIMLLGCLKSCVFSGFSLHQGRNVYAGIGLRLAGWIM